MTRVVVRSSQEAEWERPVPGIIIGFPHQPDGRQRMDTLRTLLDGQRQAFLRAPPRYQERQEALVALARAVLARQEQLVRAVSDDFGGRAAEETMALELFPLLDQIRHARRHLRRWMRRRRVRSTWFLLPSRAFLQYQPLGVVGILGAWNYPVLLALSPMVDALAAGNHVMVKPSELAPRTAALLAGMIADTYPSHYITCVTGGPELASAFTALPFDHLLFTGSARTGRKVMAAAAANLTPVTLELGGKSPAIIHRDFPLPLAVERIMAAKLLNAGQTCVAPDYVLLPEGMEPAFEREARRAVAELYPALPADPDYTRIVTPEHLGRLRALVEDAAANGARVVPLAAGPGAAEEQRVFAPTLVFGPGASTRVMQEEVFGPILPVVGYRTIDDVVDLLSAGPPPLALYYFDNDAGRVDTLLSRTSSGGVTINDCMFHLGQHRLPFGGVGQSGMGHYHGFDGFVTFSKKRGVMVQPRWTLTDLVRSPWRGRSRRVIETLLKLAGRGLGGRATPV